MYVMSIWFLTPVMMYGRELSVFVEAICKMTV